MKTRTPKQWASFLDNQARKLVKLLYDKCATCNRKDDLQWAHVFGGYYNSVRWHPLNYARQCPSCNARHNDNPRPYLRWFVMEYGEDTLDKLEREHGRTRKFYIPDYKRVSEALEGCTRDARPGMAGGERRRLFESYFGVLV